MSSAMLLEMTQASKKPSLNAVVARNLSYFMAKSANCQNANALSVRSKGAVSPQTVRNLLDPKQRPTTTEKFIGYPTLDTLATIAEILGVEVWELLHPDIERARREQDMYRKIEQDFVSRKAEEHLPDVHNKTPSRKSKAA